MNVIDAGEVDIRELYLFGDVLLGVDENEVLRAWTCAAPQRVLCEMAIGTPTNRVTCLVHPDTYLNKMLCGREDGSIQVIRVAVHACMCACECVQVF